MKRLILWVLLLPLFVSAYAGNTVIPGRVSIKHFESDGVGFNGGYTSAQAMMAVPFNYQNIPFIDLRYHVFDRGRSALNAGLGYRFNADGVLLGLNAYYDARWTTGQTFSQFGGGLEMLSRFLDFRANGYFPVKLAKQVVDAKFAGFAGHGLGIKVKERYALTGGNAELGAYIGRIGQIKMYLAGGGYYFKRQVCNTKLGATGRLRFSWLDNIWAQFSVQHDHLFQTNYQGTVAFNYPFWPKPRTNLWNYFPNFEALMIQPVERNEIIALCDVSSVVQATDKNGAPIFIWFVDNTSSSDGTFESPFPTLVQAQNASSPGQYIYVYPGDGTTTGMDAGITLQSKQFFYGAGVEQLFITSYGVVKVPAQAGANPNITNTAGTGITLASGNVVRGFNILSPTNIGINGSNVGTSLIDKTSITGAGSDGIRVAASGSNTVNISVIDCTAASSGGNGINLLPSNSSSMTATVQGSSVNSNTSNGLLMMAMNTSSATITVNSSNTFNNNGADGVSISAFNQTLA
ncbi:MAG TPA: inverse autotransporter beta domain-containing protein, partial [Chlamydiales bacterium]|nr:inverse autotransporter beta domain-containing protein [Chlamydiales bacterium]